MTLNKKDDSLTMNGHENKTGKVRPFIDPVSISKTTTYSEYCHNAKYLFHSCFNTGHSQLMPLYCPLNYLFQRNKVLWLISLSVPL